MTVQDREDIIPRPPIVRDRLARALREARLLRRQLRLSEAAAEERHRETAPDARQTAAGKDGVL
jgi:hypothetical protein